jgi:hypothetical protein
MPGSRGEGRPRAVCSAGSRSSSGQRTSEGHRRTWVGRWPNCLGCFGLGHAIRSSCSESGGRTSGGHQARPGTSLARPSGLRSGDGSPGAAAIFDRIVELIEQLRALEQPADFYEFQRLLFGLLYELEERRSQCSRMIERLRRGRGAPGDVPPPPQPRPAGRAAGSKAGQAGRALRHQSQTARRTTRPGQGARLPGDAASPEPGADRLIAAGLRPGLGH